MLVFLLHGILVFQVITGAKQRHQLVLVLRDVPLHDVHAGSQQALKSLDVNYWKKNTLGFLLSKAFIFLIESLKHFIVNWNFVLCVPRLLLSQNGKIQEISRFKKTKKNNVLVNWTKTEPSLICCCSVPDCVLGMHKCLVSTQMVVQFVKQGNHQRHWESALLWLVHQWIQAACATFWPRYQLGERHWFVRQCFSSLPVLDIGDEIFLFQLFRYWNSWLSKKKKKKSSHCSKCKKHDSMMS